MGEKNDAFCACMEKKDIFADFINGTVFGGRKAVMPEELEPVVKVVFYHGNKKWEACRDLHGMLNFEGENEVFREYTANYRMNLYTLEDLKEEHFTTGLRDVVAMMKRADDKEAMKAYCRENEERFQEMEEETYDVISVMINHRRLEIYKEGNRVKGGKVNMCKALNEMMEDSRRDGLQAGRRDGIRIGEKRGERNGEQKFAALAGRLMADSRTKDLEKAVNNETFRRKLYREYGMK